MNIKPKFELGQLVVVEFKGNVEGVDVVVQRKVFVIAIRWAWTAGNLVPRLLYSVAAKWPRQAGDGFGKTWDDLEPSRLRAVEPVVEAIAQAQPT